MIPVCIACIACLVCLLTGFMAGALMVAVLLGSRSVQQAPDTKPDWLLPFPNEDDDPPHEAH